jgi:hypothetical protein
MVGTIVNFYPDDQTADVSINGIRVIVNSPYPNTTRNYPQLNKCPVIFLNGGGGRLTFPIVAGDTCLIMFNDRDIDSWFQNGNTLIPPSMRMHDLADGFVLVGIRSLAGSLATYLTDGAQLIYKSSNVTLKETSAQLNQGSNTVAVEDKIKIAVGVNTLLTALDALCSALISATITGGAFSAGTIIALINAKAEIDAILK